MVDILRKEFCLVRGIHVLGFQSHHYLSGYEMVMSAVCCCLLQRLVFSEMRHFSWNNFPTNTMAYDIGRYPTSYMEFLKQDIHHLIN